MPEGLGKIGGGKKQKKMEAVEGEKKKTKTERSEGEEESEEELNASQVDQSEVIESNEFLKIVL